MFNIPRVWEIVIFVAFGIPILAFMFGPMIHAWWVSRSTWNKPK